MWHSLLTRTIILANSWKSNDFCNTWNIPRLRTRAYTIAVIVAPHFAHDCRLRVILNRLRNWHETWAASSILPYWIKNVLSEILLYFFTSIFSQLLNAFLTDTRKTKSFCRYVKFRTLKNWQCLLTRLRISKRKHETTIICQKVNHKVKCHKGRSCFGSTAVQLQNRDVVATEEGLEFQHLF